MSEEWATYPCSVDETYLSVLVDVGIAETLASVAPTQLLRMRITFRQPDENGMYAEEEFDALNRFDDALDMMVQAAAAVYVGRITGGGHREYFIYTPEPEPQWAERLRSLGRTTGYPIEAAFGDDPEHSAYREMLYPSTNDWQVIADLNVLESLRQSGDNGEVSRPIDHFAYFPHQFSASRFCEWLRQNGYNVQSTERAEDGEFCVAFMHHGTVLLGDISSHTIALRNQAEETGGRYDGWGTSVCNFENPG